MGSASTLLMLRTVAVWNCSPRIVVPLILASMGQWGMLIHGIVTIRSQWSDVERACIVEGAPPKFMEVIFLYCVLFDLVVLVLTTTGLYLSPARSSLWQLLFRQGIIYFIAAFVANMIPTIFLMLNLNSLMNIMFHVPAIVITSIVSCRSFVSLTNFTSNDVYVYPAGGSSGNGVIQAHTSYGSGANDDNNRRGGGKLKLIAFRSMGAGSAESMEQAYCMDELTTRRGCTPVVDLKSWHDSGGASETGGVLMHITKIAERDSAVQRETHENETDLEKTESLSHGHKSFVPEV